MAAARAIPSRLTSAPGGTLGQDHPAHSQHGRETSARQQRHSDPQTDEEIGDNGQVPDQSGTDRGQNGTKSRDREGVEEGYGIDPLDNRTETNGGDDRHEEDIDRIRLGCVSGPSEHERGCAQSAEERDHHGRAQDIHLPVLGESHCPTETHDCGDDQSEGVPAASDDVGGHGRPGGSDH